MWLEYTEDAFDRVNDRVAKKALVYLAHHEPNERTCKQIIEELDLDLDESQLDDRLRKLAFADLIYRVGDKRYQGLGDPIFAMVFRKIYGDLIRDFTPAEIRADIERELIKLQGRVNCYKGVAAEERVAKKLVFFGLSGKPWSEVFRCAPSDIVAAPFKSAYAYVFMLDQRIDVDLYCPTEQGPDLIVEVKDKQRAGKGEIDTFVSLKEKLSAHLQRPTCFLFYSDVPSSEALQTYALEKGLLYCDGEGLAAF